MTFTEDQIGQFAKHAKCLGMKTDGMQSFGYTPDERHCMAYIMNEATTYSYGFHINNSFNAIQVNYFVGEKQYNSKMTLEQFLAMREIDVEWLQLEAESVNASYRELNDQLKVLSKSNRRHVENFLHNR